MDENKEPLNNTPDNAAGAPAVVNESPAPAAPSSPAAGNNTQVASGITTTQTSKKPSRKLVWLLPLAVVLAALAYAGYKVYPAHAANKKFNDFALAVKNQELEGAKHYVQVAATVNDLGNLLVGTNSPQAEQLNKQVSTLRSEINQACKDLKNDVKATEVDQRFNGVHLSAVQKTYVSDAKKVIGGLENTEYSNKGACLSGPAIVSFAENFATLLPGLDQLATLSDNSLPTASQMATLKSFTTLTFKDETALKSALPNTDTFLNDAKTLLSDLYYEMAALQNNNTASALQYASKIESLAPGLDADTTAVDQEIRNFDTKVNASAIKASQDEIAAIDYLKKQKVTNSNVLMDYNLPAFRITEAIITGYSDSHDGGYPVGTSVDDITKLDSNMQQLSTRGFLKHTTYSVSGSDRSGFSLETILDNGTHLTEKVDADTQSV